MMLIIFEILKEIIKILEKNLEKKFCLFRNSKKLTIGYSANILQ